MKSITKYSFFSVWNAKCNWTINGHFAFSSICLSAKVWIFWFRFSISDLMSIFIAYNFPTTKKTLKSPVSLVNISTCVLFLHKHDLSERPLSNNLKIKETS